MFEDKEGFLTLFRNTNISEEELEQYELERLKEVYETSKRKPKYNVDKQKGRWNKYVKNKNRR